MIGRFIRLARNYILAVTALFWVGSLSYVGFVGLDSLKVDIILGAVALALLGLSGFMCFTDMMVNEK